MKAAKTESAPNIPNRAIFVWTGREFPYNNRLAVESVLLADPEVEVEIHLFDDEPRGAEHFEWVARYERVTVSSVDFEQTFTGLPSAAQDYCALLSAIPKRAYGARSYITRYGLLYERGGVYLDFDILAVSDFRHLLHCPAFIGEEHHSKVDVTRLGDRLEPHMILPAAAFVVDHGLRWMDARLLGGRRLMARVSKRLDPIWSTPALNTAVIGSAQKSAFIERVLNAVLEASPHIRFNLGPTLVARVFEECSDDVVSLPPEVFFVQPPTCSFRYFYGKPFELPPEAVLIHYVASNHGQLLQQLSPATLEAHRDQALFYQLAYDVAARARELPMRNEPSSSK